MVMLKAKEKFQKKVELRLQLWWELLEKKR